MNVEFKEIHRFFGYRFGSDGSLWSRWTKIRKKIGKGFTWVPGNEWKKLNPVLDKDSYPVTLIKNSDKGKFYRVRIHILTLEAFRGCRPDGMECRHLDGNQSNGCIENLEWATHQSNIEDKKRHGTHQAGENHGGSKLNWCKVRMIKRAKQRGVSTATIAKTFGVSKATIQRIVSGNGWNYRPSRTGECLVKF